MKKKVKKKSTKNCHFYSRKKSLHVAWACFRNILTIKMSIFTEHFDPSGNSYCYADFQRAILGICHSLVFCDEHFQVYGVNFLMDYGAVKMKHLSFGGSENMKKRSQHFQVKL